MTYPKIKSIKAQAIVAPLKRPIITASGIISNSPLVLIDIAANNDIIGRSYIFAYTSMTLKPLVSFIQNVEEILIGKEILPLEVSQLLEGKFRLLGRQGLVGMVISGIDMALWDALAKHHNTSVAHQLGANEKTIQAYDSYGDVDANTDSKDIEDSLKQGFKGIKIKIGFKNLKEDVKTVKAIRNIIGSEIALMVDANQSLTVPEAIRIANELEVFNLEWLEEPVQAEDVLGHATVRENIRIPVQTGENWWFIDDAKKAILAGASDFAMPDIMKIGGVTGWLRVASLAQTFSLPISPHLFPEICPHVMSATPTAHWQEFLDIAGSIQKDPIRVVEGCVTPKGPGFGIEWDDEKIQKYRC